MLKIGLYIFILVVSVNSFAEDNTYFVYDSTTFNDDFSESYRINAAFGKEYNGYLAYVGGTTIRARDSQNDSDNGLIFGASKRYSESFRMRSRITVFEDIGVLGRITLFGKVFEHQSYYLQCQKNVVDNSEGITRELTYKGCNLSYEIELGDFGIVGDYAKYDFSDGNEKDIRQARIYYDINGRIRLLGVRKETTNDIDSPFYFSPFDWEETYGSIEITAFKSDNITHKIDIGYGTETIDGFDRTPIRFGYTGFFDINNFSMRARIESRINSNYKFIWSGIDFTYNF